MLRGEHCEMHNAEVFGGRRRAGSSNATRVGGAAVLCDIGARRLRRWWRRQHDGCSRTHGCRSAAPDPRSLRRRLQQCGAGLQQGRRRRRRSGLLGRCSVGGWRAALRHGPVGRPCQHAHGAPRRPQQTPISMVRSRDSRSLLWWWPAIRPSPATRVRTFRCPRARSCHTCRPGPRRPSLPTIRHAIRCWCSLMDTPAARSPKTTSTRFPCLRATATSSWPRFAAIRVSPT